MKVPGKIIFKAIVGSQAYGTNVEGSDIDIKGIYIQDSMDVLTFNYQPQVEVNKDEVYYEVRRFVELLGSANPTVLELLFTPEDCVLFKDEIAFQMLERHKLEFLTKECKNSFGGYARQQIKKASGLDKKMNWEKETMTRKTPLDFCYINKGQGASEPLKKLLDYKVIKQEFCGLVNIANFRDCYALYWDKNGQYKTDEPEGLRGIEVDTGNALRLSSIAKDTKSLQLGTIAYSKDAYTQHCNKYKEYQTWLKERNTQRYVDINEHGQSYDGKNLLHCMRLIMTATDIAHGRGLRVRRSDYEIQYLKRIRKGEVDLAAILSLADEEIKNMDVLFESAILPDKISKERQQYILYQIRMYVDFNWNKITTCDVGL